ncbi:MAG: response regulator transcription factor [Lewinellaceae bacterium]|nr:response regulator transcription factor [Lewinellaceae bacterium]
MTALIIDDEPDARGVLSRLLERFCPHITVCAEADSVTNGLAAIQQHRPAVVFLDVDLREGNGFDILDAYPRPDFKVVFITAHNDFALQAYKYRAFHYLLKPIDLQDLIAVTNELEATNGLEDAMLRDMPKSTTNGKIILPTLQGLAVISPNEISYVFSDDGYASVVLESGEKIFVSRTLREIMDVLPEAAFFRPHQSYLVRLDAVCKVHKGDGLVLVLRDKTPIPVSRRNREEVLRALGL